MNKIYDLIVFVGRFHPVHNAHVEILKQSSMLSDNVLVVLGSCKRPISYRNPFPTELRKRMLEKAFNKYASNLSTLHIAENIDTIYSDEAWVSRTQKLAQEHVKGIKNPRIAIVGHKKDSTSEYLDWFPNWEMISVDLLEPLDATQIRSLYFCENHNLGFVKSVVPETTFDILLEYRDTKEFQLVINERKFLETHHKIYQNLPYPPTFQTADSVVTQSGHVLVVKRRAEPGKGLYALPGGYLNAEKDKTILDAALRELQEETGLKIPYKVLKGSVTRSQVFDAISRSERGRIITQAFKIELNGDVLPKIKGSDDAEKAIWMPYSDIRSEDFFEDHFDILKYFLNI
jgi:bifunctional NMN adenylyltransferase/nudix hydrolase